MLSPKKYGSKTVINDYFKNLLLKYLCKLDLFLDYFSKLCLLSNSSFIFD